jgi:hypothetical protein
MEAWWSDTTTGILTVSVAAEDGRARAAWSASTDTGTGVAGYVVQVDTDVDFAAPILEMAVAGDTRSVILGPADGLRYGGAYYFRVAARDGASNQSAWSAPSNRLLVTDQTTGPAIVHAPVPTAYVGQAIPVEATATCEGVERSCSARLYWRTTPITGLQATIDGVTDTGWQVTDLTRGAATTIDANRDAIAWSGTIPGAAVSTSGVDYFLEAEDTGALATVPGGVFVGSRYATGVQPAAHAYHHVHVVSPPLLTHVPPAYARDGEALPVHLQASCSTGACQATLYYRTTTGSVLEEDLLATPAWPRLTMTRASNPTSLGDAGQLVSFSAEIPADDVDTRGVDYFFSVTDGVTQAWWPGTTYQGYYAPTDGMRTAWHHVHTLEPPHVVHEPAPASPYREPVPVRAQANCTSGACTARLYYRTTTSSVLTAESFDSGEMTVTSLGTAEGVEVIDLAGAVPASYADTRGVDYFFSVTDGATTTWWPGTAHVDGYVPVGGTRVAYHHTRITDPPHFAHVPVPAAPALRDLVIETELTCVVADCTVELGYTTTPTALAPAFTTVAMTRVSEPVPTPVGLAARWRGTVPARDVITTGLGYYLRAYDGYVTSYQPGTSYWGAYLPVDGIRTAVHVVRVLEPPHLVHAPVATAYRGQAISIEALSNCATGVATPKPTWPSGPSMRPASYGCPSAVRSSTRRRTQSLSNWSTSPSTPSLRPAALRRGTSSSATSRCCAPHPARRPPPRSTSPS